MPSCPREGAGTAGGLTHWMGKEPRGLPSLFPAGHLPAEFLWLHSGPQLRSPKHCLPKKHKKHPLQNVPLKFRHLREKSVSLFCTGDTGASRRRKLKRPGKCLTAPKKKRGVEKWACCRQPSQSFGVSPSTDSAKQLLGPQARQHLQQKGLCWASARRGKLLALFSPLVNSPALSSGGQNVKVPGRSWGERRAEHRARMGGRRGLELNIHTRTQMSSSHYLLVCKHSRGSVERRHWNPHAPGQKYLRVLTTKGSCASLSPFPKSCGVSGC